MTVGEIVNRVRAAIDEVTVGDSQFILNSEDVQNLTTIIIDKIGYALQHIIEVAPLEKLEGDIISELSAAERANFAINATTLIGTLELPTDLLRIVSARLSSWSLFPIPQNDNSPVYLMQQDPYARGSWDRPVNILTYKDGKRVLEMYCAKTTSDTLLFHFIRRPEVAIDITDPDYLDEDVGVPTMLEASLVYQVAALTMVAFREDIASTLFGIAQKYLDTETTLSE